MLGKDCLATKLTNPFEGTWTNDYGSIVITNCDDKRCKIKIETANGAHTCDLEEKLTILSSNKAVFQLESLSAKKSAPINLSLSKHIVTINVPQNSREAAREHCGMRGFFEGEYTNTNTPRIYSTSFNCYNKTMTKIEVAICQSPELANADIVLAKLYFQLKAKQFNNIVNQQKVWMKDRNLCFNSTDLNQCLSDKYRDRILALEQDEISTISKQEKKNEAVSYNYDYLFYLSKLPETSPYDIFQDPPLQSYLKSVLPKETVENILPAVFHEIQLENINDSLILMTGGAPGLYTICEGALVLTKDHKTWLAYININDNSKTQVIVLGPQGSNLNSIPEPLKRWVDRLLPIMNHKDVVYKQIYP